MDKQGARSSVVSHRSRLGGYFAGHDVVGAAYVEGVLADDHQHGQDGVEVDAQEQPQVGGHVHHHAVRSAGDGGCAQAVHVAPAGGARHLEAHKHHDHEHQVGAPHVVDDGALQRMRVVRHTKVCKCTVQHGQEDEGHERHGGHQVRLPAPADQGAGAPVEGHVAAHQLTHGKGGVCDTTHVALSLVGWWVGVVHVSVSAREEGTRLRGVRGDSGGGQCYGVLRAAAQPPPTTIGCSTAVMPPTSLCTTRSAHLCVARHAAGEEPVSRDVAHVDGRVDGVEARRALGLGVRLDEHVHVLTDGIRPGLSVAWIGLSGLIGLWLGGGGLRCRQSDAAAHGLPASTPCCPALCAPNHREPPPPLTHSDSSPGVPEPDRGHQRQ